MKRYISMLAVFTMVLCLFTGCGTDAAPTQPTDPVPDDFCGLVLAAPADVTVNLYTEFENGTLVSPYEIYKTQTVYYHCYKNLVGAFHSKCSGVGYYTVTTNIVMSQEDNQGKKLIDVSPGKKNGTGWEPSQLSVYTQELMNGAFNSDPAQWPEYAPLLTSPYFTGEHAAHQITTQEEMVRYLQSLDDPDDRMYIFSAGTSNFYRHDIPLVIFTTTDLSGATTIEEAAQLLGQDKLTLLYRAQMHGNEPAAGEAALAMVRWLDGALGDELLDQIHICVIPRQSPDGAQNFERTIMGGIDPNRDSLRLQTPEVTEFTRVCNLLEPEVIIDGHEYNAQVAQTTLAGGEILVGVGYTNHNTAAFRELGLEIAATTFDAVTANGMDYRYYSNYVNSINGNVSRCYWSQQGTMFILLETRGIGCGLSMYTRRIVCQLVSAEAILRYAAGNAEQIQGVVDGERQHIIDTGSRYDSDNKVILQTNAVEDPSLQHDGRKHSQLTGLSETTRNTPKVYSHVARSRIAPTAYVIPAGESFTEDVLELMDKHGITYTFLPAGSRVKLQQYSGSVTEATLTEEQWVTFPEGAYVFCRNQVRGNILSMLMEPDVDDVSTNNATLVQQGMIRSNGGKFPIYRYIHDLNDQGFIDYQ